MSSDTRYLSREFITEFIQIYQSYPCLWQVKCKEYMNKNLKNKAYEKLVEFCKKAVPDANREFVTKKIQNLRAAFRKEMKKVEGSKRSGVGREDLYETTLWYYDLLTFTLDTETVMESVDNISIDSPEAAIEIEDVSEEKTDENMESQTPINRQVFATPASTPGKKQKRKHDTDVASFMKTCADALKTEKMDEYDAIALNVAAKLRKMDAEQAMLAELIINKVLFQGTFKKLTTETTLTEPSQPSTRISYTSPTPIQYVQSPLSSIASTSSAASEYYDNIGPILFSSNI